MLNITRERKMIVPPTRDEFIYQVNLLIGILEHCLKNSKCEVTPKSHLGDKSLEKILKILKGLEYRIDNNFSILLISEIRELEYGDIMNIPINLGLYIKVVLSILTNIEELICETYELTNFLPIIHSIYNILKTTSSFFYVYRYNKNGLKFNEFNEQIVFDECDDIKLNF